MSSVLYDKLQSLGIPVPPEEVTDSKVTRWGHNKRYWAVRFTGGYTIGDWVSNLKEFAFEEGFSYRKCKQQIEEAQRKLTKKKNDDNANAATIAKKIWDDAKNCEIHPYLKTKQIQSHNIRMDRQTLLIPLYDENGTLTSLQKIWPNNNDFTKGFLKGSRIQGSFFSIGSIDNEVVVCEGYATGATIHEITGLPVVISFSSNNLKCVAIIIARKYPKAKITIAADNDRFKQDNPGLTKAKEAAAAVNARLVVPEFTSDNSELTDFNDLYVNEGADKVSDAFLANRCNQKCVAEGEDQVIIPDITFSKVSPPDITFSKVRSFNEKELKSNELQTIFYNQKDVRILKIEGKMNWILKDICDAVGLSNTNKVALRLDEDELTRIKVMSGDQIREMYAVTEAGLYKVILRSNKPEALKFERWITHEVLPFIREHGAYVPADTQKTIFFIPKKEQCIAEIIGKTAQNEETKKEKGATEESETAVPEGFQLTEDELSYYDESAKKYITIAGYIKVIANTEDQGSDQTGKLVEFVTRRGETKQLRLHNNMIIKDGDAIHQILAAKGLFVSTQKRAKNKLSEYINACNPTQHAKIIKVSGWYENCYITENGIIGEIPNEFLIFQSDSEPTAVGTNGELQDWTENVGKLCIGNSRLILAVSAAFASILLKPCKRENFGLHFVGNSSEGKSTALYVAASVFGSRKYLRSWRSTDNGLEGIAATHNDMLLILDELGASDPRKAGDISYMFNSGQGKTRANITGAARKPYTWRIGVLSSGEKDLETHMSEANKRTYAGQSIRLLTVFAKPNQESSGLLEKLNGFNSYAALAQHIDKTTQEYYGTPMVAFVENVIQKTNSLHKHFNNALREAKEKHLSPYANGQDDRVFKFFFTIGFAGELATRYGITGWPVGEALTAVIEEFQRWIDHKGGLGNQEEKMMLHDLRCFFQKHQYSRFLLISEYNEITERTVNEAIGYRKDTQDGTVFYAYPERLREALKREKAADMDDVLMLASELKMLERTDNKHFTKMVRIKNKHVRMLVFNSKVLSDEG